MRLHRCLAGWLAGAGLPPGIRSERRSGFAWYRRLGLWADRARILFALKRKRTVASQTATDNIVYPLPGFNAKISFHRQSFGNFQISRYAAFVNSSFFSILNFNYREKRHGHGIELQVRIAPIAPKYGLKAVYLFGCYTRGEATDSSDIDLIVDTAGTDLKSLFALGALYCDLENVLQKQIDLITVSFLQQPIQMPHKKNFRNAVWREKVELYAVARLPTPGPYSRLLYRD